MRELPTMISPSLENTRTTLVDTTDVTGFAEKTTIAALNPDIRTVPSAPCHLGARIKLLSLKPHNGGFLLRNFDKFLIKSNTRSSMFAPSCLTLKIMKDSAAKSKRVDMPKCGRCEYTLHIKPFISQETLM